MEVDYESDVSLVRFLDSQRRVEDMTQKKKNQKGSTSNILIVDLRSLFFCFSLLFAACLIQYERQCHEECAMMIPMIVLLTTTKSE